MSLWSTHWRAVVTSYTSVLCFCFKYQGSNVTFSCCSGTHSVPCCLMPALFKCLAQYPRSRGKIKAVNAGNSADIWSQLSVFGFLPLRPPVLRPLQVSAGLDVCMRIVAHSLRAVLLGPFPRHLENVGAGRDVENRQV